MAPSPASLKPAAPTDVAALTGRGRFWLAGIGLALCLMLTGVFDGVFMGRVDEASFPLRISENPLSGGVSVVALCLALTVVLRRRPGRGVRFGAGAAAAIGALLVASTALLFLGSAGTVPDATGEAAGLVLGAASILLLAFWAEHLARAGWQRSLAVLVAALVLDTLVGIAATRAFPDAAVVALALAAGIASPGILWVLGRTEPAAADGADGKAQAGRTASPSTLPFGLSVACIALYGFTMGRIQSLGHAMGDLAGFTAFVSDFAISIGALLVAVLACGLMRLRHPHTVTRLFVLAFLAAALYLSGVFGTAIEPAGTVMMTVARFAIFVYIWLLACDAAPSPGRPMLAFAAGWGTFTLFNTASTKLGLYVMTDGAGLVAYTLLLVACLVGLIVVEFVPRRRALPDGPAAAPAGGPTAEEPLAQCCRDLADRCGLTARELEVLVPLVRGRSAASIASSLGMSTETARTHIRHIYQKTDIHSREELMDAVERGAGSPEAEGQA